MVKSAFKSASRKFTFKVAKMSETAFVIQAAFDTRGVGEEALSIEHESLEDLGRNADL